MLNIKQKIDQLTWYNLVEKLKKILGTLEGTTVTNTSQLTNNGADGVNPFVTSDAIPEYTLSPISGSNQIQLLKQGTAVTTLDLTPYLDDTNLARLVSGQIQGNNLIVTRDDSTTFTVDVSSLIGSSVYTLAPLTISNELKLLKDGLEASNVNLSILNDYNSDFASSGAPVSSNVNITKAFRKEILPYLYADATNTLVAPYQGAVVIQFNVEEIGQGTFEFSEFIHSSQNVNHFKDVKLGFRGKAGGVTPLSVKVENTEPNNFGTFANRRMRITSESTGNFSEIIRVYLGELTDVYNTSFSGTLDIQRIVSTSGTVKASDVAVTVYGEATTIEGSVLYDSTI